MGERKTSKKLGIGKKIEKKKRNGRLCCEITTTQKEIAAGKAAYTKC